MRHDAGADPQLLQEDRPKQHVELFTHVKEHDGGFGQVFDVQRITPTNLDPAIESRGAHPLPGIGHARQVQVDSDPAFGSRLDGRDRDPGVAASGLGLRTALIDGAIQFGDLRGLLRAPRDAPSMLDLPTDRISENDLADVVWHGPAKVDVLLAPPRIEMAEMVLVRDIEKTISLMRRLYDLVVVDTGVGLDELTLALLDQADTILEIVTYDATTIRNTIAMAETFQKIGYPPDKVRYLVNRADSAAGIDPADLRTALGREPEYRIRSEGQVVGPASNQGAAYVIAEPGANVSRDTIEVARALFGIASAPAAERRRPALAAAS